MSDQEDSYQLKQCKIHMNRKKAAAPNFLLEECNAFL